jgi:hypothetical protein
MKFLVGWVIAVEEKERIYEQGEVSKQRNIKGSVLLKDVRGHPEKV